MKVTSFNQALYKKYFPKYYDRFCESKYIKELQYYLSRDYTSEEKSLFWTNMFELMMDYYCGTPIERKTIDIKLNKHLISDISSSNNMFLYLCSRAVQEIFQNKNGFDN